MSPQGVSVEENGVGTATNAKYAPWWPSTGSPHSLLGRYQMEILPWRCSIGMLLLLHGGGP